MLRRNNLYFLVFTLIFQISFGNENDTIVKPNYKNYGSPYYPGLKISDKDSLKWPIEFDIVLDFKEIKDLDVKNNFFKSTILFDLYSDYDTEYTTIEGDTIDLSHSDWIQPYLIENNSRYIGDIVYSFKDEENKELFYGNKISKSSWYIENEFDHNWEIVDYPFDKQNLLFEFQTTRDTSIIKLNPSPHFNSVFEKNMRNLKKGYTIKSIKFSNEYKVVKTDVIKISPDLSRPMVTQSLIVELEVDRSGSWLFLKIFTGGILAYFISCMVFLLPLNQLESRVNLAVGAIFGAIGNRYSVDSTLPSVQIFTKADAINNLIIIMVVLNILIMILQNSDKTIFEKIQKNQNAFLYSICYFLFFLILILIW